MKDRLGVILLVVVISVVAGIALVAGIHNTVQVTMLPIVDKLASLEANQRILTQRLTQSQGGFGVDPQIIGQLTKIENQINGLQNKLNEMAKPFEQPAPPAEDFDKVYDLPIGDSPVLGKKQAPIIIVKFSDFQCPFCARFYPPIKEVLKTYPDKVQFVIKNFPLSFHPNSRPAAKLALAANEQGKYYEIVDLLLQNGADVSENKVKDYAKELKLNYEKLTKDLKDKDAEYEKRIEADMTLGSQADVRGTPTFYLNGKKTNARDFAAFKQEIDKILSAK